MSKALYSDDVVSLEARDGALYLKGAPGFHNASDLATAGIDWLKGYDRPPGFFQSVWCEPNQQCDHLGTT